MILQVLKGTGCIGGEKLFGRLFEQDISESNHLNNIGESDTGVAERSEEFLSTTHGRDLQTQAELALDVVLTVQSTPNPSFRRVDAQVFLQSTPLLRVSTVLGRY